MHLNGNLRRAPRWPSAVGVGLGAATALGGLLVAVGWLAAVPGLVRSRPGPATVTLNEAAAFAALGVTAVLLNLRTATARPAALRRIAIGAASLAGLIAVASLIEDLAGAVGLSFAFGQLVVHDHYTPVGHPGRMAPEAAAALLFLAGALLVEALWPRHASVVAWLSGAALVIVVMTAVELAGSNTQLFGLAGTTRIALPSTILLTFLGCAVQLAESDRGGAVWSLWVEKSVRASVQARAQTLARQANAVASSAPDLASAFRGFAECVAEIVPFDRTSYIRLSDDGSRFQVQAVWGPDSWRIPVGTTSPVSHDLIQRYLSSPVVIDQDLAAISDPDGTFRLLLERGIRSVVVVPLVARSGVRSLVNFSAAQPNVFSPDDVATLQAVVRETAFVFDMLVVLHRERQAVEKLQELDRLKNEFVGMIAHDLRSPMGIIAGFADTLRLRWNALNDQQREEFLGTISRNVAGLAAMVEDVLDVARIESGEFSYKASPFSLAPLVRRTVGEVVPPFGDGDLVLRLPDALPLVMGDEQRLWQVLTNLISNARKFSGSAAAVQVSVTQSGDDLRVEVTDHGPGIAPQDQQRVFDKFTRLPVHVDGMRVEGTGLGLYICRSLVEAQGGSIGVDSVAGMGATFWFTVPVAKPVVMSGDEIAERSTPA